ncbi:ferrochelatase [Corynebacterium epidermidicanis]|uniref:Coproporphyrin III ferrochelatase n=1 Tax=Corynebacterium epidermidicanis TaxID=1050174 RepID=A0A0G3GPQ9_9CORY|nr:ferrochelatase [Corynebacterium epidermidicanis]AKK03176.1 ferrochelatase [Corynebacterium epidermidicanis]
MTVSASPFDALLVLSFGGPEGPDDVRPFLENVTAGRGIPPERLDEVGAHYFHFGGVSPLNALNREIIANLEQAIAERGWQLPIYFGNRNWHPFGTETAERIARDGHRKVAVFATSAWGGYSGCKQYNEDIAQLRAHLAEQGLPEVEFVKLRQFYDHPLFIKAFAEATRAAFDSLSSQQREHSRLVFTAHSIPTAADEASGLPADGPLYSSQVGEASRLVAAELGITDYDLVWQSRSGAPHIPWLEPDIVDHAHELHEAGVTTLIVCPIGFISDHIEVIWDLDSELQTAATADGQHVVRVGTPGPTAEFTSMVLSLIDEYAAGLRPGNYELAARLGTTPLRGCTRNGAPCAEGCCPTRPRR